MFSARRLSDIRLAPRRAVETQSDSYLYPVYNRGITGACDRTIERLLPRMGSP